MTTTNPDGSTTERVREILLDDASAVVDVEHYNGRARVFLAKRAADNNPDSRDSLDLLGLDAVQSLKLGAALIDAGLDALGH